MTANKKYTMRFAIVALAVGVLSPSVSIQDNGTTNVSMFNTAQAKQKVKHKNVKHNKNINRNVKHKNKVKHNSGHYNNHHNDNTAAKVVGGMVVGAAIVKATED